MLLTFTNEISDVTPTIIRDGSGGQTPSYITNPDHSLRYRTGTVNDSFLISFGPLSNIGYVALSACTAGANGSYQFTVLDGVTTIATATINNNHNAMLTFTERNFTDLRVEIEALPTASLRFSLAYCAAGATLEVPNGGEQSGYSRQWLLRHQQTKTVTNDLAQPTAALTTNKPLAGTLNVPNILASLSQSTIQSFIDFAYSQPFFIKEVDDIAESSYVCFDPSFEIKAHPTTRVLDAFTVKFKSFNGL